MLYVEIYVVFDAFAFFFQKKVIFICVYEKILLTLQSKYVNIQN